MYVPHISLQDTSDVKLTTKEEDPNCEVNINCVCIHPEPSLEKGNSQKTSQKF